MANGNGNGKVINGLQVGVVITLISAIAGGAFLFGAHVGDTGIHEKALEKEERIRTVVEHELDPRLERMEADITQIKNDVRLLRDKPK